MIVKQGLIAVCCLLGMIAPAQAASCGAKPLEIRTVAEGGTIIELNDGSRWAVERADQVFARVWLQAENVLVCEEGLMKPNDARPISATRIQ
ncbi:hypothetical protein [Sinorhizobium meliloti]|nr:hypothetical protein [Sinorhizobium meliloti]MDW9359074.1 hypothetical protein [Sinorhizobium meliloti]MDW9620231.1 hypothetical protein [Sinorhizobium meliloti]MDW9906063.1 hypothetical protein [Sinorhizobium meliloti]MDW9943150.1 hypothetical protein [Sinorhizobium meliloti]MQX73981.1 hypothetical protein [Sinorhizobium meliloti]